MSAIRTAEDQHRYMTETPVPKLVVSLGIPTVFNQLITVIYNTADTYFVSAIGTSAAAASGVVFSVMSIIQAFGFGIAMGAGSLVSIRLGEKRDKDAEVIASSGFAAAVLLGAAVAAFGLTFLKPLMTVLGATETMLPYACDYAEYIFISAPLMCGSFVLGNILRSEGEAKFAAFGLCIGGILNMLLDPLLIFTLGLGISGAAIATAISQTVGFIILFAAFLNGKSVVRLSRKSVSTRFSTYYEIISTGIPTVFRQGLGSVSSALLNRQASIYGDAAVAAVTIATKVYVLIRNIVIGIGQGFQPVAGYNFGAGDKKRTGQSFKFAALIGTAVCIVFSILTFIFSKQIIMVFRDDPEVIKAGTQMLRFFALAVPFLSYSTFVNQLYQCLGFKKSATLLASCRQGIFFIPLLYILTHFFGFTGIELTQTVSDLLFFAVSIPFQAVFFKMFLNEKEPPRGAAR